MVFASKEKAISATHKYSGKEIEGRRVTVKLKPNTNAVYSFTNEIMISNLPNDATETKLKETFVGCKSTRLRQSKKGL